MTQANSYQLFLSERSPFARRVRLTMRRLKLPTTERIVNVFEENPDLMKANPLGMIPTVITPDGKSIFDSATILEYLHEVTGAIWPESLEARFDARVACALAEGIIQSTVLFFQEQKMHEVPSNTWLKDHFESVERTLHYFNQTPSHAWIQNQALTQAGWDMAVAIEYLALRIPEIKWKEIAPGLVQILELANQNADFKMTAPKL